MKTEVLDRCLELFRLVQNDDKEKIEPLSDLGAELRESFIEPFRRELGLNLISKATFQEKNDLVIFYMEELDRTIIIDREFKDIEPLNYEVDDFHYPIWYNDQDLTDDSGIAKVRAHILFSELFEVIQEYCNIYHIPFMELCKDRHFILETINLQPTHDFEEISAGYKTFEKLSADQPQDMPSPEIGRPVFAQDYLHEVYEIIRDFFSTEDQVNLLYLLENSSDVHQPVVFLDSGNRLADAFKQLYEADIIRSCKKKELESWICRNFAFVYRNKVRPFIPKYLNEIISTTKDKCQRPFLDVKFDKAQNKNILVKL
ncbi:MAG: hypothetical protein ABSD71_08860 [Bacteroidales bacterium]|jgi:hypothetical protein